MTTGTRSSWFGSNIAAMCTDHGETDRLGDGPAAGCYRGVPLASLLTARDLLAQLSLDEKIDMMSRGTRSSRGCCTSRARATSATH
jgi:hypothetical protein